MPWVDLISCLLFMILIYVYANSCCFLLFSSSVSWVPKSSLFYLTWPVFRELFSPFFEDLHRFQDALGIVDREHTLTELDILGVAETCLELSKTIMLDLPYLDKFPRPIVHARSFTLGHGMKHSQKVNSRQTFLCLWLCYFSMGYIYQWLMKTPWWMDRECWYCLVSLRVESPRKGMNLRTFATYLGTNGHRRPDLYPIHLAKTKPKMIPLEMYPPWN